MGHRYSYLINSCDNYSDLWEPLFILLKRYNSSYDGIYYLNTENKNFAYDGMNIKCLHSTSSAWGKRIKEALATIPEEYVVFFLDDFFLRQPVETEVIERCALDMERDSSIACFYFLDTGSKYIANYIDDNQYSGFLLAKHGKPYLLNCQAAVWKKDILISLIKDTDTPWSFELLGSKAVPEQYKFYFLSPDAKRVIDYGNRLNGEWGVVQGKWCVEDVDEVFKENDINVCYSKRGVYKKRVGFEHLRYSARMKVSIFKQWWSNYRDKV